MKCFFLKHVCTDSCKCQELTNHIPSKAAMTPAETWIRAAITKASAKFTALTSLKNAPNEGTIISIIDIMWRTNAENIINPCCRYLCCLFTKYPEMSKARTTISIAKPIVDLTRITINSHLKTVYWFLCKSFA
jgi:hypothetical protein